MLSATISIGITKIKDLANLSICMLFCQYASTNLVSYALSIIYLYRYIFLNMHFCRWWANALYIQNLLDFNDGYGCVGWTWYVPDINYLY